jgi:ABC-type multidrug transport system ATPase subunit
MIVDEPTAGLDPTERNRFLNLLSSIGDKVIVILSTHIVDDVRELCSRMAIIREGELIAEGAPEEAVSAFAGKIWKKTLSGDELERLSERGLRVVSTHLTGGRTEARVYSDTSPGDMFVPAEANLQDVYFLSLSANRRDQTRREP